VHIFSDISVLPANTGWMTHLRWIQGAYRMNNYYSTRSICSS
jgi:hypothetical protein